MELKQHQTIALAVGLQKDDLKQAFDLWVELTEQTEEEASRLLSGLPLMAAYSFLIAYKE